MKYCSPAIKISSKIFYDSLKDFLQLRIANFTNSLEDFWDILEDFLQLAVANLTNSLEDFDDILEDFLQLVLGRPDK